MGNCLFIHQTSLALGEGSYLLCILITFETQGLLVAAPQRGWLPAPLRHLGGGAVFLKQCCSVLPMSGMCIPATNQAYIYHVPYEGIPFRKKGWWIYRRRMHILLLLSGRGGVVDKFRFREKHIRFNPNHGCNEAIEWGIWYVHVGNIAVGYIYIHIYENN